MNVTKERGYLEGMSVPIPLSSPPHTPLTLRLRKQEPLSETENEIEHMDDPE